MQDATRVSQRVPAKPTLENIFKSIFFTTLPEKNLRRNRLVLRRVHAEPNIYEIDDFLTENDISKISEYTDRFEFQPSFVEDASNVRLLDKSRTSTNIPLPKTKHFAHIDARAAELLGMHQNNVELMQVVRYTKGQRFDVHHDMGVLGDDDVVTEVKQMPRRLATFFVYLNDVPAGAGGETEFPRLKLKITPKRRKALLFCNVCEDGTPDLRVVHCGRPVIQTHTKLGLNLWVTDKDHSDLVNREPDNIPKKFPADVARGGGSESGSESGGGSGGESGGGGGGGDGGGSGGEDSSESGGGDGGESGGENSSESGGGGNDLVALLADHMLRHTEPGPWLEADAAHSFTVAPAPAPDVATSTRLAALLARAAVCVKLAQEQLEDSPWDIFGSTPSQSQ